MCKYEISRWICDEQINWLKSLKNRVGCEANFTTTKEWSEEDERTIKRIDSLLYAINESDFEDIHAWLKSLKPQNRWKPSDEQIKALANALSLAKSCGEESSFDLRTLYEQLKENRYESKKR